MSFRMPKSRTGTWLRPGSWPACFARAVAWMVIVVGAIAIGGDGYERHQLSSQLEIDAEIAGGTNVEVFVGREAKLAVMRKLIQPGKRTKYLFDSLPAMVEQLRIDFTDLPGTRVQLCRLTLRRGSSVLADLSPADLRQLRWSEVSLAPPQPAAPDSCLELLSTGNEPSLRIPPVVLGAHPSWVVRKGIQLCGEPWLFLAGPCVLFLLWRWRSVGLLLLAPILLAVEVPMQGRLWRLWPLRVLLPGYQQSNVAVGFANYTGYPKLADHRILVLAVLLMAGLSYLAARVLRARPCFALPSLASVNSAEESRIMRWGLRLLLLALVLLNVALRLPDVVGLHQKFLSDPASTQFDSTNYFTWGYAYWSGWVPLRDFWYPYGDFIVHWAWTQVGFAKGLLHVVLTWAVIGRCLFVLSNRSYRFTALVFALVAVATAPGLMVGELRYNLSLGLVLLGLVSQRRGWQLRDGLWLAVFAGYSLSYEVHQIAYAALPLAVIWLIDLIDLPVGVSRGRLLRWLAVVSASFLFFAAVWMLDLARQGRLGAQLDFLLHSAGMVAYASLPSNVGEWFFVPVDRDALVLYFMLLSVGLGVTARVVARRGDLADIGTICLACGLLAALTMQKQIVRPHMANQLLPGVVLPLLFWILAIYRAARSFSERAALVGVTVLGLTVGFGPGPARFAIEQSRLRIQQLPAAIAILADTEGYEAARRHYYFAPDMYPGLQPLLRRLRELVGPDPGVRTEDTRFFVLGDDPYLYVALRQRPAPYITLYDTSPLSAQQKMVRWLHDKRPEYVVFRPGHAIFDGVPNVVRVPLLFAAVVEGYEFLESIGEFHILRRRSGDRPISWAYLRNTLGVSLPLGALPAHSRLASLPTCEVNAATAACAPVLQVHVEQPVPNQPLTLVLSSAGGEFEVSLLQVDGVKDYAIALSSLWFWPGLSVQSAPPLSAWRAPAGVTLGLSQRAGAANILF